MVSILCSQLKKFGHSAKLYTDQNSTVHIFQLHQEIGKLRQAKFVSEHYTKLCGL